MIKGFEDITAPLTKEEMELVPVIIAGFKKHVGKYQIISSREIVKKINENREKYGLKSKFTDVRLRKIINHITGKKLLPIVATGKGYYTCYKSEELRDYTSSLISRIRAIKYKLDGINYFINKLEKPNNYYAE